MKTMSEEPFFLADGKGGPAGREFRSAAKEANAKLFYISRDTHHVMESCCDE